MPKSVTVIGGGAAGLSAAVFLADKDFDVTLIEASPKLGGRAYSFFDKSFGATIDNGQHILASWYHNTFDFLKIIGSFSKLTFQKQLEVKFTDDKGIKYVFKCPKLPPPLHLLAGIQRYKALEFKDKTAIVKLVNSIRFNKIPVKKLREINTDELFSLTGQTERLINYFWKPFIIAVFNAEPKDTSASMFTEIVKTGFLKKGGSELVLTDSFLSELYVEPAIEYLNNKKAKVLLNNRINRINFNNNSINSLILTDNSEIKSDFYISAVPFFEFKNLVDENVYRNRLQGTDNLKPSPIVNIHLRFDKDIDHIITGKFTGLLNTRVQWAFKVKSDQLCLVISSAKDIAELDKDEIISIAVTELQNCLPEFKDINLVNSRVIKEMRATFVPDAESLSSRPENKTKYNNFFIAGDWTNTGLPATIESAVKSSSSCVNLILSEAKNLS